MPLASRRIDPVASYVRFEALPQASSEGKLQGVAVSHMAGLIHQLSWLAGYSAEMFNGVFKAQADTFQRLQVCVLVFFVFFCFFFFGLWIVDWIRCLVTGCLVWFFFCVHAHGGLLYHFETFSLFV